MAEFLNKEAVNVSAVPQSIASQANSGGNLAKDLGTLMQSFSGIAQDYHKSMITQSEQVGSALARDNLMSMIQNKQQTVQQMIDDPRGFEYDNALRQADMDMANTLADVSTKLGNDSVAKKAYDNVFLMRATELNEGFKANIYKQHKQVANEIGIENNDKYLATTGNAMGTEALRTMYEQNKVFGLSDDKQSAMVTANMVGGFLNSGFDAKKVFVGNGTPDIGLQQKEFKKHFDSIATMNNDGSITSKLDWVRAEDLAKIKQNWDSKITVIKEKNERNIGFHLAVDEATYQFKTFLPNTPEEALKAQEQVYGFVEKQYSQASNPSPADQEKYLKFKQDIRQANEDFNIAYGVATSDPMSIGKVISTGQNNLRQKVDTTTVKRIVTNGFDGMLNKALETGDVNTIKKVVSLEGQTGINSTVTSKFNTLVDFNKAKTMQEAETNLKNSLLLIDGGYSHGNEKLNKEMIEDYLTVITEGKISGSNDDAIRIKLNEKKNDHILNSSTKSPEYLQANQITLNKLTTDDTKLQGLLGFGSSVVAGEVKVNRGTKSNSFQEFGNALAKTLQNSGIRLDSNRPADEGDNLDKIKNSGYVYVIDNPFWNAEVVLLPDTVSGSVKRPISGEVFFDGIKKSVSVIKGIDFDSVDMDKVRTEPINTPTGLQTRVYYDNVVVKTFSGNELQTNYKTIDEKKLTKSSGKDSFNYLTIN